MFATKKSQFDGQYYNRIDVLPWGLTPLGPVLAIGVRAGGAGGAAAPPNFGQLRFFGQQKKFGQSQF